ncbi:MAG: phosphate signaling complex protein PhoU, partial [Phycisphaerales bacterium]
MLEAATEALLKLDIEAARTVMRRDDEIDREEVIIEEECLRLLALFQPFARDFRTITTLLRVNADLERVADHATSIAKVTVKLHARGGVTQWPTSLQELTQRVPMLCHALLNSLLSEDLADAHAIFEKDKAIDKLDKRLFEECLDAMTDDRDSRAVAMLMYRCGRELERVGDLMTNIAEDMVYLVTGSIVRHEKRQAKAG